MGGRPPADLCAEFTARVHAAIAEFGSEFETAPLLAEFQDRGVSRASVFRWVKAARASAGAPVKSVLPVKKPAAISTPSRSRPAVAPVPVAAPAPIGVGDIAARLPAIPQISEVRSMGLLPVLELLQGCISHAQDLIAYARSPEGKVRNARLLMQASEHLRRAIETAARLNETVAVQREMQQFHALCLEEIGREQPAVQERILNRLQRAANAVLSDG